MDVDKRKFVNALLNSHYIEPNAFRGAMRLATHQGFCIRLHIIMHVDSTRLYSSLVPRPWFPQLRVDYITATWKEGLEECSHPVVPCAPDFRRTIRMQSTRDVTHGVLFNTNLEIIC